MKSLSLLVTMVLGTTLRAEDKPPPLSKEGPCRIDAKDKTYILDAKQAEKARALARHVVALKDRKDLEIRTKTEPEYWFIFYPQGAAPGKDKHEFIVIYYGGLKVVSYDGVKSFEATADLQKRIQEVLDHAAALPKK